MRWICYISLYAHTSKRGSRFNRMSWANYIIQLSGGNSMGVAWIWEWSRHSTLFTRIYSVLLGLYVQWTITIWQQCMILMI